MENPVANVHMRLYGSDSAGAQGTLLDSTGTNADGNYSLTATQYYDYFNVIKYDPAGYHAYDAEGGYLTKVNSNWLQGHYLEGNETYSENYFFVDRARYEHRYANADGDFQRPTPTPTSTPGVQPRPADPHVWPDHDYLPTSIRTSGAAARATLAISGLATISS